MRAMPSEPEPDEAFKHEQQDLLIRKNKDYGDTSQRSPVLAPSIDSMTAIQVRMSDKIARLQTLLAGQKQQVKEESIRDTMIDLAGYVILWECARRSVGP